MHLKIPCPTMIKLFFISFIWSLHFMTQGRWREEKKFSHLLKIWKNLALKSPRPKLFVNKNAIKSNFGNYTNEIGNIQIGWERLREFGHWAWEFLCFGSSHTDCVRGLLDQEVRGLQRLLILLWKNQVFLIGNLWWWRWQNCRRQ